MSHITSVLPKEEYRLEVILDNGSSVTLDLKSRIQTVRFGILSDNEFFKEVTTDGVCLSWKGKLEISINEVFQLVQK